jgi:hypothetical protein
MRRIRSKEAQLDVDRLSITRDGGGDCNFEVESSPGTGRRSQSRDEPPGDRSGVCMGPLSGRSPYQNQSPISRSGRATSINDRSAGRMDSSAPLCSSNSAEDSADRIDAQAVSPVRYRLLDPSQDLTRVLAHGLMDLDGAMHLHHGEAFFMAMTGQVSLTDWLKGNATDLGIATAVGLLALGAMVLVCPPVGGVATGTLADSALIALPDLATAFHTAGAAFGLTKAAQEVLNLFSEMETRAVGLHVLVDATRPSWKDSTSESSLVPHPQPGPTPDLNYSWGLNLP